MNLKRENYTEKERRNIDILEILRRSGPISRPEISKEMGINVVTISNYVDEFIRRNLVCEKDFDVSEGGRRPVLLDLNPQAGLVVGVGLNLTNMVGLLVDLKGNIVTKTQVSRPRSSAKEVAETLLEIIREVLVRSKGYSPKIKGIGIGIAGLINKEDGSVLWPQKIDGDCTYASVELPLKGLIEKEFDLPVLIENDATSACFGEHWMGLEIGFKNVLYMFSGVGCGIMINGEVYRGAQGYAGEVSIANYKADAEFNCQQGNPCFMKRWEMDLGILESFKASGGLEPGNVDLRSVFVAARAKNDTALSVLQAAAKRLGIKIAFLVNLLNPEVVVIGGGLEEAGGEFLNNVSLTVKDWAFKEAADNLKIIYSQLRENAVAMGAASLMMQKIFSQV
ncbi:MAG: ROK family transcriptional regulator [Candidatus Omnitrophica bacterium]|nr:ROK family transcriptional regulator [Candidatus Omnitrophota bacterium]MBL7151827.1 ROK family transcriptional regulator [Candidatus Omnitrophota bacterium]